MLARIVALILMILLPCIAWAQNNPDLARMYAADQAARRADQGAIDRRELAKEDAARRDTVLSLLKSGDITTPQDYYNAAMIFQHGSSAEDVRMAHAFVTISAALSGGTPGANWLKAATWDRLMYFFDQPQWYGTQFVRDDAGEWSLYKVQADVISDEQRAAWSVPSLQEAEQRAATLNGDK